MDVEFGQAVSGEGTISGGGLIGTLSMSLIEPNTTLAGLSATPSADCSPAAASCYDVGLFSCGCALTALDTAFDLASAMPIDSNGIAFQVGGGDLNYGLALYNNGDGTVGVLLVGDAAPQPSVLIPGEGGGTLTFQRISEPGALALFSVGMTGLTGVRRRGRHVASGA